MSGLISIIALNVSHMAPSVKLWEDQPDLAFDKMSLLAKYGVLTQQCLLINYLNLVYGYDLPLMFSTYQSRLDKWLTTTDSIFNATKDDNSYRKWICETSSKLCNFLLRHDTRSMVCNEERLTECYEVLNFFINSCTLDLKKVPCAAIPISVIKSFYEPYLRYLFSIENHTIEFTYGTTTLPTILCRTNGIFTVTYDVKFSSYNYNVDLLNQYRLNQNNIPGAYFKFLFGLNWTAQTLNGVLGYLASHAIEFDSNYITIGSLNWMYYHLYKYLFNWKSPVLEALSGNVVIGSENIIKINLMNFLIALRERYNILFNGNDILSILCTKKNPTKQEQLLVSYLEISDNIKAGKHTAIGQEAYTAFKQSIFAKYPELDVVNEAEQPDKDNDDDQSAESKPEPKEEESETKDNESKDKDNTEDNAQQSSGETQDDEDTDTDDFGKDDNDSDKDDTKITDDKSNENDNTIDEQTLADLPEVSDAHGVEFTLNTGDTLDTYLWREELDAYLKNILSNPPSNIDKNNLLYLKKLRMNWLWLLSIRTVSKIVEQVIKLPRNFKVK